MSRYMDRIKPHTVHIYALVDPMNKETFYIGKTRCELSKRLHLHNTAARKGKPTKTCTRIRQILSSGNKPLIISLTDVNSIMSRDVERMIISQAVEDGYKLTNMRTGGGGG